MKFKTVAWLVAGCVQSNKAMHVSYIRKNTPQVKVSDSMIEAQAKNYSDIQEVIIEEEIIQELTIEDLEYDNEFDNQIQKTFDKLSACKLKDVEYADIQHLLESHLEHQPQDIIENLLLDCLQDEEAEADDELEDSLISDDSSSECDVLDVDLEVEAETVLLNFLMWDHEYESDWYQDVLEVSAEWTLFD